MVSPKEFMDAYIARRQPSMPYSENTPFEMMASDVDDSGWFVWKPMDGTLQESDYQELEQHFGLVFPKSFIEWHRAYYFLDGDCSIVRLPSSNPNEPLEALVSEIECGFPEELIPQKLYPFADEGNDGGPLVFDAREPRPDNEFPIRFYDHDYGGDLEGLSGVIFSSFPKLLECLTHFLSGQGAKSRDELVLDFLKIDPDGAGSTGVDYWQMWAEMLKDD